MTYQELKNLDREKTIVFSSISPVETHGPHLPLGTDIYIAENLRDKIIERLSEIHPEYHALILPTIPFGAGAIPVDGSIMVSHRAVHRVVLDTGKTLRDLGFKYWILADNHGDPFHEIAIEAASRKLDKKGLHLLAPFNLILRHMVGHHPELMERTKLGPGECGDSPDSHAGTNETSLMLASYPDKVRDNWNSVGPSKTSPMKLLPKILSGICNVLKIIGAKDASLDFYFMATGLAWISDPEMDPYRGNPLSASIESGEAMYHYQVELAIKLFEDAHSGNRQYTKPLGWSVQFLRYLVP
jgi:creatinine amidohydrolase